MIRKALILRLNKLSFFLNFKLFLNQIFRYFLLKHDQPHHILINLVKDI